MSRVCGHVVYFWLRTQGIEVDRVYDVHIEYIGYVGMMGYIST